MRGLNAYLKTQQYINLATSGIANNIIVFRVQTGITALVSLVPRPTPFFVLRFPLTIIHGCGRAAKNAEGLVPFIT